MFACNGRSHAAPRCNEPMIQVARVSIKWAFPNALNRNDAYSSFRCPLLRRRGDDVLSRGDEALRWCHCHHPLRREDGGSGIERNFRQDYPYSLMPAVVQDCDLLYTRNWRLKAPAISSMSSSMSLRILSAWLRPCSLSTHFIYSSPAAT